MREIDRIRKLKPKDLAPIFWLLSVAEEGEVE